MSGSGVLDHGPQTIQYRSANSGGVQGGAQQGERIATAPLRGMGAASNVRYILAEHISDMMELSSILLNDCGLYRLLR